MNSVSIKTFGVAVSSISSGGLRSGAADDKMGPVVDGKRPFFKTSRFTLAEIIMAVAIMLLLAAILLPSLRDVRQRAKYTRWFAYNQSWNRDADCVINYNFQDGKKDAFQRLSIASQSQVVSRIKNGAYSCDWNNSVNSFNATDYDGIVVSPSMVSASSPQMSLKTSKGGAMTQGGRWGTYKQALDFSGAGNANCYYNTPGGSTVNMLLQCSSYTTGMIPIRNDAIINSSGDVVCQSYNSTTNSLVTTTDLSKVDLQRDAVDFTGLGSFTVIAWVNFGDKAPSAASPQCIFSRACGGISGVTNPTQLGCAGSQYDIFTDIQSNDTGAFDVECINQSIGYPQTPSIKFKDTNWKQVVLRYNYPPPNKGGTNDTVRAIDCFVNGVKVSGSANNYTSGSVSVCPNPIARSQEILSIGGYFWYGYPTGGQYEYTWPFCGKIDEFMVLKKALSDTEIQGEYLMGSE